MQRGVGIALKYPGTACRSSDLINARATDPHRLVLIINSTSVQLKKSACGRRPIRGARLFAVAFRTDVARLATPDVQRDNNRATGNASATDLRLTGAAHDTTAVVFMIQCGKDCSRYCSVLP